MADGARTTSEVMGRFSAPAREWFTSAFAAPTSAQAGAWEAISSGHHTLVVAPTGSGKTLSAFLWAIDELSTSPVPQDPHKRCRVLYISPLKALASDVERNLRAPLAGLAQAGARLGAEVRPLSIAMRSGDTPAAERRQFTSKPPDVLITTPESLFLLLTSRAREQLAGVETVILDEVHAVAGTKRGAHLAVSLERLDALLERPAQRIGLSATVRPVEEVARFLAGQREPGADGGRPVTVVQPPSEKKWDLTVVVPVPDMTELGQPATTDDGSPDLSGAAAGAPATQSIWPHVEERVVDLVAPVEGQPARSSLVFTNSRRLAERLTARLNETWADRLAAREAALDPEGEGTGAPAPDRSSRTPAEVMAQAGSSRGAPAVLARAHHGSVSKEQRALIEDDLKSGRLPTVVATSSLELGIDMGAVDLVVQVESPPSVSSGLQRVGRAGHQVGAVSRGVMFPKFRADLVTMAVVTERMRSAQIESLRAPANPLDVLAQHVVAMTAMDDWEVDELHTLMRRSAPFATLSRPVLESVLDMLSGRYPSEEFAELRPRVVWDRIAGTLAGRPGAQRLAVTSGGTIPDRGLYGVFLATGGEKAAGSTKQGGRRVGELDEEMVYESRVGDVFTLGASTWRIEDITHDQVLVTPAPGQPGRLPFWHGDQIGRPLELGRAVGEFVRELDALTDEPARARLTAGGLDAWAADNLLGYLREQRAATGHVPDDRTIVIERFRDELGDWRVVVHSPFGAQVHGPWALAMSAAMRDLHGLDVQAMPADDGIVLRMPDFDAGPWEQSEHPAHPEPFDPDDSHRGSAPEVLEALLVDPGSVQQRVTDQLGGSALFAARFRECAARALLLPRRRPDRRQPLWQQRQRAASLLEVASRYPTFPIVLETVRECLQDVFDVPGLEGVLRSLESGEIKVVEVTTDQPSPFARSLLFGYVAQFLYEGDSPLAERRAAALALDPDLLAELLGGDASGTRLADLLDPEQVLRTHHELQRLAEDRRARSMEEVADLLRVLGPLSQAELVERSTGSADDVAGWVTELGNARRAIQVTIGGAERVAAAEDAGRLRDALGTPLPVGLPLAFTEVVDDPLGQLVARYARTRGPFTALGLARRFGLGVAVVDQVLGRLQNGGRLVAGELLPDPARSVLADDSDAARQFCDAEVMRTLRRRSLAALRAEVEPVDQAELARFLPTWQQVNGRLRGAEGVLRVVEQLAGAVLPASALESLVLPARVDAYSTAMLDELTSSGEVLWCGHGELAGDDGWISLHLPETAHLTLPVPEPVAARRVSAPGAALGTNGGPEATSDEPVLPPAMQDRVLEALGTGGAFFFRALGEALARDGDRPGEQALSDALWELVWSGRLSNDTLSPLRARLRGGRTTHKARAAPARARYGRPGRPGTAGSGAAARHALARSAPPAVAGRWSLLPEPDPAPTQRAALEAELLLERYGVVTRGSVAAEGRPGGFAAAYRVLAAFEESGRVRRGYFVEGLGASQFATTAAVDRLRAPGADAGAAVVLAAGDPANPYGAALPWPETEGTHRPARKSGALVVLRDGALVLYAERGARTVLTWTTDTEALAAAGHALATVVRRGRVAGLTVQTVDGAPLLGSDHPIVVALTDAGFHATPRGLRLRG